MVTTAQLAQQLAAETAARKATDSAEATARASADSALTARVSALEAAVAALTPPPPVIVEVPKVVPAATVADIVRWLADDTVDVIDVADGRVACPTASTSQGLWIDGRFAARTRPVTVRPHTDGGVVLDGGGADHWEAVVFQDGAHDIAFGPFRLANATVTQGGAIVFGQSGSHVPTGVRDIAMRGWSADGTVRSGSALSQLGDHFVYFSSSSTPSTGITLDDFALSSASPDGLDSAAHFYIQPALGVGPQGVRLRRWRVSGTDQALVFYDATLAGVSVEDTAIAGARKYAVRYHDPARSVTLQNVVSTGSGLKGLLADSGTAGLTLAVCSLS